jgi:hypothetical protein
MVFVGYVIGAALMLFGGVMEWFMGISAEQRQLEDVAEPLAAKDS